MKLHSDWTPYRTEDQYTMWRLLIVNVLMNKQKTTDVKEAENIAAEAIREFFKYVSEESLKPSDIKDISIDAFIREVALNNPLHPGWIPFLVDKQFLKKRRSIVGVLTSMKLAKTKKEAEDIADEAMSKLLINIKKYNKKPSDVGNLGSYLIKIAINIGIDIRRNKNRNKPNDLSESPGTSTFDSYMQEQDSEDAIQVVYEKINQSTKDPKKAKLKCLVFHYLTMGLNSREIAEELNDNEEEFKSFAKKIDNIVQGIKDMMRDHPYFDRFFPIKRDKCPNLTNRVISLIYSIMPSDTYRIVFKKALRVGKGKLSKKEIILWETVEKIIKGHPKLAPLTLECSLFS